MMLITKTSADRIRGVLLCYDKIIIQGTLLSFLCYPEGMPLFYTNRRFETSTKDIFATYVLCWFIENNIQKNIDFFSLNALSFPVIARVNFDIAKTLIANSLNKVLWDKLNLVLFSSRDNPC